MEKIFKARWWDYKKRKFNINGRICLENGFWFGVCGVVFVKYIHPVLINFLYSNGFEIIKQECCFDKKLYFNIGIEYSSGLVIKYIISNVIIAIILYNTYI